MNKKDNNIILHVTNSMDNLVSILNTTSLRLSFSSENFSCNNKIISQAAHPMICFSEYNYNEIDKQKITYGKYGVGFSKDWARKKNIGPVLYVGEYSTASKGMATLLKARRRIDVKTQLDPKIRLAIMEVKCFIKNEIGYNSSSKEKIFDFKSENEWRFIPQKKEIKNYLISQNQSTYLKNKEKHNRKLKNYPLKFELNDLKIVFVSSLSEKNKIIRFSGLSPDIVKISNWET